MPNTDYLIVDRFLKTELDAQALNFALRSGLIDLLKAEGCSRAQIPVRNPAGRRMILDLLTANGIVHTAGEHITLTQSFRTALNFLDLIEAKIAFATAVARDLSLHFASLIDNLPHFMENSATFGLFRYDRCFEATPENLDLARRWMRYTTALTRYEGRVLADLLDLSWARRALDIGGNSGELALQLCRVFPDLSVTVFDLPVVCQIGREHVARAGCGVDRIAFQPGDMRRDALYYGADVVFLKSVLHDWPDEDAAALLSKAADALRPGGLLVIFERAPLRMRQSLIFADLTNFVFAPFFRHAGLYLSNLSSLGFVETLHRDMRFEMDFHLITATKA